MPILGQHTVHELKDLIAAKQADLDAINKAYGDNSPEWVKRDPKGFIQFTNDRDSLNTRWDKLKTLSTLNTIGTAFALGNEDIVTAESQYQDVVSWAHDLQKLFWAWPSDMFSIPPYQGVQPTAPDVDMNVVRKASDVVNPIAKELDQAGAAASDAAKSAAGGMKPYLIGGGILLGLLAIIAIRR
jgi:hypothetical protein